MKKKPKPIKSMSARLAAVGCRSPNLRKADGHQLMAARCLIGAGQMLLSNTFSSLEFSSARRQAGLAIAVARVQLAVADRLHTDQFAKFIDSIMREEKPARRKGRAK